MVKCMNWAGMALIFAVLIWATLRKERRRQRQPRELCCVPWATADRLIKKNEGWQLAPEEDDNKTLGWVWLERRS